LARLRLVSAINNPVVAMYTHAPVRAREEGKKPAFIVKAAFCVAYVC
jgi:hypothetical protein